MRSGLRPLSTHIGMAASYWQHSYAQGPAPALVPEDLQKMLLGIQKYQQHPYRPEKMPLEQIWKEGCVTVNAIPGHDYKSAAPAILLVPSLINKADILDLMPQRSMLRWLSAQNINPYLLDWGESCNDGGQNTMDALVLGRLVPALEYLQQKEQGKIHALGYCMGGTISMAAAAHMKTPPASLVLLASPWDFHGGTQALLNRIKFWWPTIFTSVHEKAVLSADWVQMLFASLDPLMTVKKFSRFEGMNPDSDEAHLFIAVEDWLNDGIDLPGGVAQHCINDWFMGNAPGTGSWVVGGRRIIPEEMKCPVLIIASEQDRLVEFETAGVLQKQIEGSQLLNPACGHIGMIAGGGAVEKVWQPVAGWLHQHT